jgi:hypothetical protein
MMPLPVARVPARVPRITVRSKDTSAPTTRPPALRARSISVSVTATLVGPTAVSASNPYAPVSWIHDSETSTPTTPDAAIPTPPPVTARPRTSEPSAPEVITIVAKADAAPCTSTSEGQRPRSRMGLPSRTRASG